MLKDNLMEPKFKHSIYEDYTKVQPISKILSGVQWKATSSQNNLKRAYVCKAAMLHDIDQVHDINVDFQTDRDSLKKPQ